MLWKQDIPDSMLPFCNVVKTAERWHIEIFNFFDHNYTYALSENINNLIKAAEKAGRGYTFEVLRAKMLYDNSEVRKPTYFKKPDWAMNYMTYVTLERKEDLKTGYIVDIKGLTELLESDYF